LTGNAQNNALEGGAGNDTLNGAGGADNMIGGLGDDRFIVNDIGDIVTELLNEGTDRVNSSIAYTLPIYVENLMLTGTAAINGNGNGLNNILNGNGANNELNGQAGNDTLNGVGGNDTLIGWSGADTMLGGLGDDTYFVENVGDVVTEFFNAGTDTVSSRLTYTLPSQVENLTLTGTAAINGTGNTLANVITGNTAANQLNGLAGNDTLNGGSGNDTLNGGAGIDALIGGTGADTLLGGQGDDIYGVDNVGDIVTELLNEGKDMVSTQLSYTLPTNVEHLTLTGTTAVNGTGNGLANTLIGNTAANQLNGLAGNDTLDGGTGTDILTGGIGNDIFKFTAADSIDSVTDFNVVNDTIQLENAVFTVLSTGLLESGQFRVGTQAQDGNDYVIYHNTTGALLYDPDGNGAGAAVQIATLSTGLAMTNADIIVI
jgi:Ca2+-binding RTX toxin-like protein